MRQQRPPPPGTAGPAASSLGNKNIAISCSGKSHPEADSTPRGNGQALVLRTGARSRQPPGPAPRGRRQGAPPGRAREAGVNGLKVETRLWLSLAAGVQLPRERRTGTWGGEPPLTSNPQTDRQAWGQAVRCPVPHPGPAPGLSLLRPPSPPPRATPPLKQGSSPGGGEPGKRDAGGAVTAEATAPEAAGTGSQGCPRPAPRACSARRAGPRGAGQREREAGHQTVKT